MVVLVEVMPKEGILDPQGKAVGNALRQMGYEEVGEVKIGKIIRLELDETDPDKARARAEEMGRQLLANPNVERFRVVFPEEAVA